MRASRLASSSDCSLTIQARLCIFILNKAAKNRNKKHLFSKQVDCLLLSYFDDTVLLPFIAPQSLP